MSDNQNSSITIIVAIISVVGTIVAALIYNWEKLPNNTQLREKNKNRVEEVVQMPLCEVVMLVAKDAKNNFQNVRFQMIHEDKEKQEWVCAYQNGGLVPKITYDKNDWACDAEILIYKGNNLTVAKDHLNTTKALIDACIGNSKQSPLNNFSRDIDYEFSGSTYYVYVTGDNFLTSTGDYSVVINIYWNGLID